VFRIRSDVEQAFEVVDISKRKGVHLDWGGVYNGVSEYLR